LGEWVKQIFVPLEQISYDCEKLMVQMCPAVTMMVPCPSILIGQEVLRYMIGEVDFLNAVL
jgi:hypothetical protein